MGVAVQSGVLLFHFPQSSNFIMVIFLLCCYIVHTHGMRQLLTFADLRFPRECRKKNFKDLSGTYKDPFPGLSRPYLAVLGACKALLNS